MKMPEKVIRFAEKYANWSELRTLCLTFNIDFVPDFMLERLLHMLAPFNVAATFFATHDTPVLQRIRMNPQYELAIHPFNNPASTQGNGLEEILGALRRIVPEAAGNRFHRLEHSYRDLLRLGELGYIYDASAIRHNTPFLLPAWHNDMKMVLLTTLWEDGSTEGMGYPMRLESVNLETPGMKILAFHPLNVYLNSKTPRDRSDFLRTVGNFQQCSEETARHHYGNDGEGARGVLRETLELIRERQIDTVTARQIAESFMQAVGGKNEKAIGRETGKTEVST